MNLLHLNDKSWHRRRRWTCLNCKCISTIQNSENPTGEVYDKTNFKIKLRCMWNFLWKFQQNFWCIERLSPRRFEDSSYYISLCRSWRSLWIHLSPNDIRWVFGTSVVSFLCVSLSMVSNVLLFESLFVNTGSSIWTLPCQWASTSALEDTECKVLTNSLALVLTNCSPVCSLPGLYYLS